MRAACCFVVSILCGCDAEHARRFHDAISSPQFYQGAQMMSGGGMYGGQAQCPYQRQWLSGMYRTCVYNCMGSEVTTTVSAASLCPLSTPQP